MLTRFAKPDRAALAFLRNACVCLGLMALCAPSLAQNDDVDLEKLRTESGIDPTRIQSRAGFSALVLDAKGHSGQVNNRLSLNLGVNRWNLSVKYDQVNRLSGEPGSGFESGSGDLRFSALNAFYVNGKHAFAAGSEWSFPTSKPGFGLPYFAMTPSLTYSYTFSPSFILAIQPQYTFALMRDAAFPALNVFTLRMFVAKFTRSGYFLVFEPRPVVDFTNETTDLILSPIVGKSIGGGFNLILLGEYPLRQSTRDDRGIIYQFGFNKNF